MAKRLKVTPAGEWTNAKYASVDLGNGKYAKVPILRIKSVPADLNIRPEQYEYGVAIIHEADVLLHPREVLADVQSYDPDTDNEEMEKKYKEAGIKGFNTFSFGQRGVKPTNVVVALREDIIPATQSSQ